MYHITHFANIDYAFYCVHLIYMLMIFLGKYNSNKYNKKKKKKQGSVSDENCVCVCVCVRVCVCVHSHSGMSDSFATSWTVACQAPLSVYFSRQEKWSG